MGEASTPMGLERLPCSRVLRAEQGSSCSYDATVACNNPRRTPEPLRSGETLKLREEYGYDVKAEVQTQYSAASMQSKRETPADNLSTDFARDQEALD